jgi:hypothetical protein
MPRVALSPRGDRREPTGEYPGRILGDRYPKSAVHPRETIWMGKKEDRMRGFWAGLLSAIAILAFFSACSTLQSRWEATKASDTLEAYEVFLEDYPESGLANQARARRNELQEERDWKDAEAINTADAYQGFIQKYPQGKYRDDAAAKRLMHAHPRASEPPFAGNEAIWKRYQQGVYMAEALLPLEKKSSDEAQAADTIAADDRYPDQYPKGRFTDAAELRQDELRSIESAPAWGKIMYPKANTNIRAKRSAASERKGQLKNGYPVKVDFLQDSWYAVFPETQQQRIEKMALGYVYAPLLTEKREPRAGHATDTEGRAAEKTLMEKSKPQDSGSPVVRNITFKMAANGKELLFIEFNRFCAPAISKSEGKEPRIILEIKNTSPLRVDWASIHAGGRYIRHIFSNFDPRTRAALIVLDMAPGKDYDVHQKFYQKENLFSLEISETVEALPEP